MLTRQIIPAIVLLAPALCRAQDENAGEIVRRAEEHMRGNSSYAEMTMTIVKPDWSRTVSMKTWSLRNEFGLVLITNPEHDRGAVTLKRHNEVWNFLPAIDRVIKIPSSMMLQSWLGSDFTNDDLVKESSIVNDYTHSISGDSTIGGRPCYRITMIPKESAAVVWGKIVLFISKEGYLELRSEMYDDAGVLSKVLTGDQIKEVGNRRLPTRWEMHPADAPRQKTILTYTHWQFDIPLDESFFSLQNMRRVR
ncbi:MAG TPA: outer membrane lipoprotein-sorting protein [Bacteroidota bacterium]|nr:outer membrane lipoprotein-sorting protein [Bacteroidota bacterium]